jgi:hypothetical protein
MYFFSAVHANLFGTLPVEMQCLGRLAFLNLRNNHLTGTIPQVIMNGMTSLYSLTLSFNGETEPAPPLPIPRLWGRGMWVQAEVQARGIANRARSPDQTMAQTPTHEPRSPNFELIGCQSVRFFELPFVQERVRGWPAAVQRCESCERDESERGFREMCSRRCDAWGCAELTGVIPTFRYTQVSLKRIYLDHNHLNRQFDQQLSEYAELQQAGAFAEVDVGHNDLSGPLPDVFYNLVRVRAVAKLVVVPALSLPVPVSGRL